jgi:hypothetical protein
MLIAFQPANLFPIAHYHRFIRSHADKLLRARAIPPINVARLASVRRCLPLLNIAAIRHSPERTIESTDTLSCVKSSISRLSVTLGSNRKLRLITAHRPGIARSILFGTLLTTRLLCIPHYRYNPCPPL